MATKAVFRVLGALFVCACLAATAAAQDAVFSDGFEGGSLCAWSASVGGPAAYSEAFSGGDGSGWPVPWTATGSVALADLQGGRARFRPTPSGYPSSRTSRGASPSTRGARSSRRTRSPPILWWTTTRSKRCAIRWPASARSRPYRRRSSSPRGRCGAATTCSSPMSPPTPSTASTRRGRSASSALRAARRRDRRQPAQRRDPLARRAATAPPGAPSPCPARPPTAPSAAPTRARSTSRRRRGCIGYRWRCPASCRDPGSLADGRSLSSAGRPSAASLRKSIALKTETELQASRISRGPAHQGFGAAASPSKLLVASDRVKGYTPSHASSNPHRADRNC